MYECVDVWMCERKRVYSSSRKRKSVSFSKRSGGRQEVTRCLRSKQELVPGGEEGDLLKNSWGDMSHTLPYLSSLFSVFSPLLYVSVVQHIFHPRLCVNMRWRPLTPMSIPLLKKYPPPWKGRSCFLGPLTIKHSVKKILHILLNGVVWLEWNM